MCRPVAFANLRRMIDSKHPNRWFNSNPQAIPNHGKRHTTWQRDVPKDWRSGLARHEDTAEPGHHQDDAEA